MLNREGKAYAERLHLQAVNAMGIGIGMEYRGIGMEREAAKANLHAFHGFTHGKATSMV